MTLLTPINSSIDETRMSQRTIAYVTATPAAAVIPMKNGERRSIGGPGGPSGRTSELSFAAGPLGLGNRSFFATVWLPKQRVMALGDCCPLIVSCHRAVSVSSAERTRITRRRNHRIAEEL